jgi:hypothetical protein
MCCVHGALCDFNNLQSKLHVTMSHRSITCYTVHSAMWWGRKGEWVTLKLAGYSGLRAAWKDSFVSLIICTIYFMSQCRTAVTCDIMYIVHCAVGRR